MFIHYLDYEYYLTVAWKKNTSPLLRNRKISMIKEIKAVMILFDLLTTVKEQLYNCIKN